MALEEGCGCLSLSLNGDGHKTKDMHELKMKEGGHEYASTIQFLAFHVQPAFPSSTVQLFYFPRRLDAYIY